MKAVTILTAALFWLALTPCAMAASFDCAKARTRSEVLICKTPALSKLDEQLAASYRAALAVTPRPVSLRAEQRLWLDARGSPPTDLLTDKPSPQEIREIAADYDERIQKLKAERDVGLKAGADFLVVDLGRRCAPLAITQCKVKASGRIKGASGSGGLWYQLQDSTDTSAAVGGFGNGVVVFADAGSGRLRPMMWAFNIDAIYSPPLLVQSPAGWQLYLPGFEGGTAEIDADLLFHQVHGRWRDVDIRSWQNDLGRRLPKDRVILKAVIYDFHSLSMTKNVWRVTDGDCCPTGGEVHVRFRLPRDKLEISSVKLRLRR
jgi:uncharacterized protein